MEHKIVLLDPETPPFKERFCRIPPPQVDEVQEHLKMMLDAGAICPSNSPWCNAVVLVRKKDSTLRFCIDFRRLNSLTRKDSHPLPRIGETLDSLVGSAYYSTVTVQFLRSDCSCTVCGKSGLYFSFILQPLTVSLQYDPILFHYC